MERKRYPEESRYQWLTQLLDCYHMTDSIIKADLKDKDSDIPCKKGCSACCDNMRVPINKTEMFGISWFVVEHLKGEIREKIEAELEKFKPGQTRCPFLIEDACSIYAVRPLACRTYYMHGDPCKMEDVPQKQERHKFPREELKKAALPILATMGFSTMEEQEQAFEEGYLKQVTTPISQIDWKTCLLTNIELFDAITNSV